MEIGARSMEYDKNGIKNTIFIFFTVLFFIYDVKTLRDKCETECMRGKNGTKI